MPSLLKCVGCGQQAQLQHPFGKCRFRFEIYQSLLSTLKQRQQVGDSREEPKNPTSGYVYIWHIHEPSDKAGEDIARQSKIPRLETIIKVGWFIIDISKSEPLIQRVGMHFFLGRTLGMIIPRHAALRPAIRAPHVSEMPTFPALPCARRSGHIQYMPTWLPQFPHNPPPLKHKSMGAG